MLVVKLSDVQVEKSREKVLAFGVKLSDVSWRRLRESSCAHGCVWAHARASARIKCHVLGEAEACVLRLECERYHRCRHERNDDR